MDQDFRVRIGFEAMTFGKKLGTQFRKVVDLAVEDDADSPILVGKGLICKGPKIDDPESSMSQKAAGKHACSRGVRAPVSQSRHH